MKKLLTILILIIAIPVFSQEMTSGAKINSVDEVIVKATNGAEVPANKFGFDKLSTLRMMNYEKTNTGDMVLKGKNNMPQDNSIEENFDRNNNVCPDGKCGSSFYLWGAASVVAGVLSVFLLKSK